MDAADFCLIPSRFEPCGLVDVEMGWNGGQGRSVMWPDPEFAWVASEEHNVAAPSTASVYWRRALQ